MRRHTLENSRNIGTLVGQDGNAVSVVYWLRRDAVIEEKPGFEPLEHTPEITLKFPTGTGGLTGPVRFTTADGRSVDCIIDGSHAIITGFLE